MWFPTELDYFKKISVVIITSHNKISNITHVQDEEGRFLHTITKC